MNTRVNLAGVELKNPVMTASGTFGSGAEYGELVDLNQLGAVVTKGVANVPWPGNPTPRIAETYGGMLNAIGLQNPGIDVFVKRDIPFLKQFDTKIIVNVCGKTTEDYVDVVERLADEPVDMVEINISCPNVKEGGIAFGGPEDGGGGAEGREEGGKAAGDHEITPQRDEHHGDGEGRRGGGADVLSLIEHAARHEDQQEQPDVRPGKYAGGMSGPAMKPMAVRMVYQVAQAVKVPIIGMGGIMNAEDALEFILAGATAVSVGTANFVNPYATVEVAKGIEAYMRRYGVEDINDLIGAVR